MSAEKTVPVPSKDKRRNDRTPESQYVDYDGAIERRLVARLELRRRNGKRVRNSHNGRCAMEIADTPKGIRPRRSTTRSAPRIRANGRFRIARLMLFSEPTRNPIDRINSRPARIGAEKLMFA